MKGIAMSLGRLLLIFSVLLAVSCGGGGGSSPPPAELGFAAPTLVEVSAAGSSSIDASWLPADDGTTPAGAMRYQVHASTLPDYLPGEATLKQEVVGAYSTRLTGLSPGTAYTVIIVAINAGGLTRASLPLTVRTADTEFPPPPTQTVIITQVLDDVGPETGLVPEGGVTDDTQTEIRGTLSAVLGSGQALKVYGNLVEIGTASVAGTNWTFWPVGLQQGDHIFTAAVVDARGQRGPVADGWLIRVTSDAPSGFSPLNDTGIDWCADASTNFVDCLAASIFPGQDAHYGRDAKAAAGTLAKTGGGHAGFDFTKLGSNGQPLSIQNAAWNEAGSEAAGTKWSCVKDNNTKLVWEMKLGGTAGLHHKDNTYTWYNTDATSNGGFAGYANGGACTGSNCDTQALVAAVNAQGWCGANDWRMPTVRELENIVDLSRYGPAIDTDYFPNMYEWDWFWSSSPNAYHSNSAWGVSFGYGYAYSGSKLNDFRVRLVRAGQ